MANAHIPRDSGLDMPLARLRQWLLVLAVASLVPLAGCNMVGSSLTGGSGDEPEFAGAVAADEPHAALAAREALAAGGSAADAAVALTFALAVTYPSAAGLGGGGQCLVYERGDGSDTIESLDFLPPHTPAPAGGGWAGAVPGTVRGMAALQARYGSLHWSRTLVAAERLARLGHPVSRAFAHDLAAGAEALRRDPLVHALFAGSDGRPRPEGETIVQRDLADVLARLRLRGAAEFNTGHTARELVQAVARAGGALAAEDLRRFRPRWGGTVTLPFEDEELHTVPGGGGAVAAAIWDFASADDRYREADGIGRLRLLAEAGASGGARPPLSDAPTTSFAVVDRAGMAVACGLTMNSLFGTGRIAPGTGVILAAVPDADLAPPLAPVVLVNRNSRQVMLVAAAGGGRAAPGALAAVLLELLDAERPLDAAVAAPRVHDGAAPGRVDIEPAIGAEARAALETQGHRVVEVAAIGRVNAIHCPDGLPRAPESCRFASDRRGFGIASGATP